MYISSVYRTDANDKFSVGYWSFKRLLHIVREFQEPTFVLFVTPSVIVISLYEPPKEYVKVKERLIV